MLKKLFVCPKKKTNKQTNKQTYYYIYVPPKRNSNSTEWKPFRNGNLAEGSAVHLLSGDHLRYCKNAIWSLII